MRELTEVELHAISRACCAYQGARERWAEFAEGGATDEEIVERLNREFGLGGGTGGPGWVPEEHESRPPVITLHRWQENEFKVKGKWLVQVVRRLYEIHQPAAEGQLSLFGN
jgi:hypothetical protein